MTCLNRVILIGNLGADPEIRDTKGGRVANLRIATTENWRDKNTGERRETTEWHSVTIWNDNIISFVSQYASKGSQLYVEGKLKTRKWQDQNGNDRFSTDIVVENFNGDVKILVTRSPKDASQASNEASTDSYNQNHESASSGQDDLDDDVPF